MTWKVIYIFLDNASSMQIGGFSKFPPWRILGLGGIGTCLPLNNFWMGVLS